MLPGCFRMFLGGMLMFPGGMLMFPGGPFVLSALFTACTPAIWHLHSHGESEV